MILTTFSEDRVYRYVLLRMFDDLLTRKRAAIINFLMLNPSTADEYVNDRTVSKCIKFAKMWGYDGLYVTNIFAYRSTDPKVLKTVDDPIGPENDSYIEEIALASTTVVAAWGQHGQILNRSDQVRKLFSDHIQLYYLRMGATDPCHPLYLPSTVLPTEWNPDEKTNS